MAKHLTDTDILRIAELVDNWHWDVKFTWSKLCSCVQTQLGLSTTRQTLQSYCRIKSAYDNKKLELRAGKRKPKLPPSLTIASRRIERLEAENARFTKEQETLLAQFLVWQYNAYTHGMTPEQLNTPLPKKVRS